MSFNVKIPPNSMTTEPNRKHPGGRPPKFSEARRPITLTLPERTLNLLETIDKDRAKAIVKAVDVVTKHNSKEELVELINVGENTGMIVIAPCHSLQNLDWIKLIQITPSRILISIPSGASTDSIEVGLQDLLDTLPPKEEREKAILSQLLDLIRHVRRKKKISKSEMLFVDLLE